MRPCREVRIRCSSPSLDYIRLIRFSTGRLFLHLCLEDEENKYVLSCEIKNMWKIFLQFKAIGSRLASCLMNILVWKIKLYIQSSSSEEWEYAAVLHHGASRILILKTMICPWNFQNYMNGSQIIHVHIIQHLQDFFGYQQRSVLLHLWVLLCSVTSTWLYSWIFNTHTHKKVSSETYECILRLTDIFLSCGRKIKEERNQNCSSHISVTFNRKFEWRSSIPAGQFLRKNLFNCVAVTLYTACI